MSPAAGPPAASEKLALAEVRARVAEADPEAEALWLPWLRRDPRRGERRHGCVPGVRSEADLEALDVFGPEPAALEVRRRGSGSSACSTSRSKPASTLPLRDGGSKRPMGSSPVSIS